MIKNFIYPVIDETTRKYGASISAPVIREDGDWRDFIPQNEDQRVNGVESSACYIEAQQASIATLQEEIFNIKDSNYSARFNALLSDGTEEGGDPLKGAYSIKKDGLIPQALMDWLGINSWSDFHSWKGVDKTKCISEGKKEASNWDKSYKIVYEMGDSLETKYACLKEALKRSPVPISVSAWFERNGKYYKPKGMRDNHLVMAVYLDKDNSIHIRDTYTPYYKVLEPNFDSEFGLYWIIKKKVSQEQYNSILSQFINILKAYANFLKSASSSIGEIIGSIFSKRQD